MCWFIEDKDKFIFIYSLNLSLFCMFFIYYNINKKYKSVTLYKLNLTL